MKGARLLAAAFVIVLLVASQAIAFTNLLEGFETRNNGQLDGQAPWWCFYGCSGTNAVVTQGVYNGVTPHSGDKMIKGFKDTAADADQIGLDLTYRVGGGTQLKGDFTVGWWFYDPLGTASDASKYCRDYVALDLYSSGVPANSDPPGGGSNSSLAQRASLGMSSNVSAGFDKNKYQARVVSDTGGYSSGWYNLNITRSVGWHQARIYVSSPLTDQTNTLSYYIDDMTTPLLTKNSISKGGFNVLELNLSIGTRTGFFDDFAITPEPSGLLAIGAGLIGLLGMIKRRK